MTEERTRGVLLYAVAAIVVLGGGVWFVRAAPATGPDERVRAWQETVEKLLPDAPSAVAETVVLQNNLPTDRTSDVAGGSYSLAMVCAGTGRVRVRVSNSRSDSGRAVLCAEQPSPEKIDVALADEFYIQISAENDQGGAVFRWRLERNRGY